MKNRVFVRKAAMTAVEQLAANDGNQLAERIIMWLIMSTPDEHREPGARRKFDIPVGEFLMFFWPVDREGKPVFSHLHHSVIVEQSLAMVSAVWCPLGTGKSWMPVLVDLDKCDWRDMASTISFEVEMPEFE